MRSNLSYGMFGILLLIFMGGFCVSGGAMEVRNESDHEVGVMVFQIQETRDAPIYVKVLQPKTNVTYDPVVSGPYAVSVMDIVSKEEFKMKDVEAAGAVQYDGTELKTVEQTA